MNTCGRLTIGALLLTVLAVGLISPPSAAACDFEPPPPPETALDDAAAVFAGEVVTIEPVDDDPGEQYLAVTFEVDRAWKGVDSSPVVVETHQDEGVCGYPFIIGDSYLVYAHSEGTPLTTSLYHRTAPLEQADEDLDVLGSGSEVSGQNGTVTGADDDEFNPGILILVAVIISIIVATVMLLRQSKPGLSEFKDTGDDYDAGEDDPAGRRGSE
jgi:hypothetical protein